MAKEILKRKTVFQGMVKNLEVKDVAVLDDFVFVCNDENGDEVVKSYQNVNVRVEEQLVKYSWLNDTIDETTLYIDNVEYEAMDIESVMGDNDNLTVFACVEAD